MHHFRMVHSFSKHKINWTSCCCELNACTCHFSQLDKQLSVRIDDLLHGDLGVAVRLTGDPAVKNTFNPAIMVKITDNVGLV